jgi:hypothetical protein
MGATRIDVPSARYTAGTAAPESSKLSSTWQALADRCSTSRPDDAIFCIRHSVIVDFTTVRSRDVLCSSRLRGIWGTFGVRCEVGIASCVFVNADAGLLFFGMRFFDNASYPSYRELLCLVFL